MKAKTKDAIIKSLRSTIGKLLNRIKSMKKNERLYETEKQSIRDACESIWKAANRLANEHVAAAVKEKDYWKQRAEQAEEQSRQLRFNYLPAYVVT
jgi:hexokinase